MTEYGFWTYGPTGKVHMVSMDVHIFVCDRIDSSDEAHYGAGSWCNLGRSNNGNPVASVLNSEADVLEAEKPHVWTAEDVKNAEEAAKVFEPLFEDPEQKSCHLCGYTEEDKRVQRDHHLCPADLAYRENPNA